MPRRGFLRIYHAALTLFLRGVVGARIALGDAHSCAIRSDGSVLCWGANNFGQVGDSTYVTAAAPKLVYNGGVGEKAQSISAGFSNTCAVLTNTSVLCWGKTSIEETVSDTSNVPKLVLGISAKSISTTSSHTCAVLVDGGLKCWGSNNYGELGGDLGTNRSAISVSLGGAGLSGYTTCVILDDASLKCWGADFMEAVGGSTNVTEIDQVSTSPTHTCAVSINGFVSCWGQGYGLGVNSTSSSSSPVSLAGLNATKVAVGVSGSSCAILKDKSVECWGMNSQGQLGVGNTDIRLTPTQLDLQSNSSVIDMALGGSHALRSGVYSTMTDTCALLDGDMFSCWGSNDFGQLGDGTTAQRLTPVEVVGLVFPSPPTPLLSCTITQYAEAYECMDCPLGSISVGGNTARCYCPENHARVVDAGEAHGYACVACDSGTFRAAGDVVPISANDASTECFARLNHENWGQISKFTSADPDMLRYDQYFGKSVAVHGNNMIVAASANAAESYSFERFSWYSRDPPPSEASFEERISVLIGDSASARDGSVAMASRSSNDAWIVFGSPRSNEAVIYACMNQICYQGKTSSGSNGLTTPTDAAYEGYFGHSVAVHGETMVVGASGMYWNDDGGHSTGGENRKGSAYVFTPASRGDYNIWVLRATLLADDGSEGDQFGRSVAIFGDTIVVGAPGRSTNGNAYVFTRTEAGSPDSNWTLSAKLSSPFSDTQSFGRSVSVDGNHASVGDPLQEKAHVFVRNTPGDFTASDDWSLEATVESDDEENHGYFGLNVVIKNDVLMVAAPGNPTRASNQRGAVLVFSRDQNTNTWEQAKEILSPDTPRGERDEFGRSVAFDGVTLVVGAYHEGNDVKGAAYVFSADGRGTGGDDVSTTAVPVPSSSNTSVAYPPPSSDTTSVPPGSLVFTDYESSASTCFGLSTVAVSVFVAFVGAT